MILGTAAYMSPEQAKGRGADRASDVWAFGCVLYEMLTGSAAFHGDSVSEALFSPDGRHLLTACDDGVVRIWDATTGEEALPALRHEGAIRYAAFSPQGCW